MDRLILECHTKSRRNEIAWSAGRVAPHTYRTRQPPAEAPISAAGSDFQGRFAVLQPVMAALSAIIAAMMRIDLGRCAIFAAATKSINLTLPSKNTLCSKLILR